MIERRFQSGLDVRAEADQSATISGYASVFNQSTRIDAFRSHWLEVIKPGAFSRALRDNHDVRALIEHDPARIIGRSTAGTLALQEDDHGLKYSVTLPDTQGARDLITSIKRGDISGSSFGFSVKTDNWRTVNGEDLREITDVDLFDVSPVAFPAFEGTSVTARSQPSLEQDQEPYLRALWRARHGLELREEDRALLTEVRAWLAAEPHPPIDPAIRRDLDRRSRALRLKFAA